MPTTPLPMTQTIQILVLCRDPLLCAGLKATLREHAEFALLPPGPNASAAGAWPHAAQADVVVADYEQGLGFLAQVSPGTGARRAGAPGVLILTHRDSESEIRHALACGARGYLVTGCGLEELAEGVRAVHRGMRHLGVQAARRLADSVACSPLTERETDVLRLVAEGQGNKAIARQLDIAIGTVKSHLKSIFGKLDAKSRTEVAAVAERRGLLAVCTSDMGGAVFTTRPPRRADSRSPSMYGAAMH